MQLLDLKWYNNEEVVVKIGHVKNPSLSLCNLWKKHFLELYEFMHKQDCESKLGIRTVTFPEEVQSDGTSVDFIFKEENVQVVVNNCYYLEKPYGLHRLPEINIFHGTAEHPDQPYLHPIIPQDRASKKHAQEIILSKVCNRSSAKFRNDQSFVYLMKH